MQTPQQHQPHLPRRQRQQPWSRALLAGLLPLGVALGGCNTRVNEELMRQGHQAMVECQHGERAITEGDELRCEDWAYVRSNYLEASQSEP
jgi:hypothetical protein